MAAPQDEQTSAAPKSTKVREDGGNVAHAQSPGVPHSLTHQPGISPGSVDVTGIVPEGVIVDPKVTEGHPGYDESGTSEIIQRPSEQR